MSPHQRARLLNHTAANGAAISTSAAMPRTCQYSRGNPSSRTSTARLKKIQADSAAHHSWRTSHRTANGTATTATPAATRNGDGAAPLSRPRLVSRKAAPPPMSTPAQTHARNDVALGRLAGGVGGFCAMSLPRFRLYRPAVRWTPSHSGVVGVWAGPAGAERLVLVRRAVGFGPVARPLRR